MILDGSRVILWSLPRWQAKLGIPGGGIPPTRQINTQSPLIGGGDLSADRLLILPQSSAGADGYLSAGDFAAFAAKENVLTFTPPVTRVGNVVSWTGDTDDVPESGTPTNLYFTDTRARAAFSATAPVALSAGGVISMPVATSLANGYLSSADWSTFNGKVGTSRAINTTSPLTGGGDLSSDRTLALDLSVSWTWAANGIGATPTDRVILSNTTAAANGAQQYSPALRLIGQGFAASGSLSKSTDWRIYNQPVQGGGANPTSNLLIDFSVGGGAFANVAQFTSAGNLLLSVSAGSISIPVSGSYGWGGRSAIKSSANGLIELFNAAASGFTRLNFGGTGTGNPALAVSGTTLKCRLADDSADAAFTALSLQTGAPSGGTAGVWKLGVLVTAAVALDTAKYIELDVGGVLYKLLTAT